MDMPRVYSSIMRDKKIRENAICNENYTKMKWIYENFGL